MTSNHGVDEHNNNSTDYVLNKSFYQVLNTNDVFTLEVEVRVHTVQQPLLLCTAGHYSMVVAHLTREHCSATVTISQAYRPRIDNNKLVYCSEQMEKREY